MKVTVSVHTGRFLQIKPLFFEKYDLLMFHSCSGVYVKQEPKTKFD